MSKPKTTKVKIRTPKEMTRVDDAIHRISIVLCEEYQDLSTADHVLVLQFSIHLIMTAMLHEDER